MTHNELSSLVGAALQHRSITSHAAAATIQSSEGFCCTSRQKSRTPERPTAGTLLDATVPGYVSEGKAYLTIALGCTGGRHRSVVVSNELSAYFRKRGLPVTVDHRDLDRE